MEHDVISRLETLIDRLAKQEKDMAELEEENNELADRLDAIEYQNKWRWRLVRILSDEENIGLPIPRLEIRWERLDEFNVRACYSLVYRHLLGRIIAHSLSSTHVGGDWSDNEPLSLRLPFRDGAHIMHDMQTLNLPAFVVAGGKSRELHDERIAT